MLKRYVMFNHFLEIKKFVNFNKRDISLCYSESHKTYMYSLVIASTAGLKKMKNINHVDHLTKLARILLY